MWSAFRKMCADAQQRGVIHFCGAIAAPMFDVTPAAVLRVRMEGCRLLGKVSGRRRVAPDAGARFDPASRGVARFALFGEEGVLRRERARLEQALPAGNGCRT